MKTHKEYMELANQCSQDLHWIRKTLRHTKAYDQLCEGYNNMISSLMFSRDWYKLMAKMAARV